jgi:hypothetical protein
VFPDKKKNHGAESDMPSCLRLVIDCNFAMYYKWKSFNKGHNWNLRIACLKKFLLFTAFDSHNSIQFCRAAHISNGSDTPLSLYPSQVLRKGRQFLLHSINVFGNSLRWLDCVPSISNPKTLTDVMFQFDKDDKSWLSVMLYWTCYLLNCVSIHAEIVRLSDCGTFLCQLFLTWCCILQ